MSGLRFCARAFSSCGKRGPLFITVRGPLTTAASPVAEHRLQTRMLSNCGSRAQPLRGMWDPPRPGLEPASPALAGRLSTTAPPGKPIYELLRSTFSGPSSVMGQGRNQARSLTSRSSLMGGDRGSSAQCDTCFNGGHTEGTGGAPKREPWFHNVGLFM